MSAQTSVSGTASVGTGFATPSAGDVVRTMPFEMFPYSGILISQEALNKGDIISLATMKHFVNGTDLGPTAVAIAALPTTTDVAGTAYGNVLLMAGYVYLQTTAAAVTIGAYIVGSSTRGQVVAATALPTALLQFQMVAQTAASASGGLIVVRLAPA